MLRFLRSCAAPRPGTPCSPGPGLALGLVLGLGVVSTPPASAAPVYASEVVAATHATAFRGGNVLGAPDRAGLFLGASTEAPVALGTLVLRFAVGIANGAGADLVVFDEHRFALEEDEEASVEVSRDGVAFMPIGTVFGGSQGEVFFPASLTEPVFFVRISQVSSSGLDVDAVQANFAVPEPGSFGLLAAGLALLAQRRRAPPRTQP